MTFRDRFSTRARVARAARHGHPAQQRGAALLTAMIIVTLVTTLASAMVWQQWRAVQVESAERARIQSIWILAGALDFGTLILNEDLKSPRVPRTQLTEPWATPLAESRLSTFLSADNTSTDSDDGPEAFLSGSIADAHAKYNLSHLLTTNPQTLKDEMDAFSRLCAQAGIGQGMATTIVTRLIEADRQATAAAPLRPVSIEQLAWLGIDTETIQRLAPYAEILPSNAWVNPNTASKEVLAAVLGVDLGTAEQLVTQRQKNPYKDDGDFQKRRGANSSPALSEVKVAQSLYFLISGQLRLADHVVTQRTLIQRTANTPFRTVIWRQYVSSVEQPGQ